jgi:hypothetical protein
MVILVIAILTAAISAGFMATTAELTTNAAQRGESRAFTLAQQGLERFMALHGTASYCSAPGCVSDPSTVDSEYVRDTSLVGGYADVVSSLVRPATGGANAIFYIRSTGTDTSIKLSGRAMSSNARRAVGMYATYSTATINVKAAWLSLSGLVKNGTGVVSGVDDCGKQPSVAGVMVDSGDLVIKGGSFNPIGSPPVDTSKNFAQLKAQTNIDWAGVQAGSIPADYTIPGDGFPSASQFADTNFWPVIRIHSNYSLPVAGQGMIIADSDFTISGSNMWNGLIMVGGQLTSNGNNTVAGATLSGLNFLTGGTPSLSAIDDATANGQKTFDYNSCYVSKATTKLRKYAGIPNTWSDNVAIW